MVLIPWLSFAQNRNSGPDFPAHRIIGNLYYVGTYNLGVFLLASEEGHILINTAYADSTPQIQASIESLGYSMDDVRILLTQQAHFDHTGALAEIKQLTGAQMWATRNDARVLEDGGFSDPHNGGPESRFAFEPVEVDRILYDGDEIELGGNRLVVHIHPGHTEGSSSYSMVVRENGRDYRVLIANMGTVNAGKRLAVDPTYPGVAADFAYTFTNQKSMDLDIWIAPHPDQYNLHDKWQPGQAYNPETFVDPEGFLEAVDALENQFLELLAEERID